MAAPYHPDFILQGDPSKVVLPLSAAEILTCNCSITQSGNTYAVNALQGNVSAPAFYSYGVPNGSSANTGFEISNTLIIFLYEDINTGIISLFLIADIANDGSGGSLQFDINCLPGTAYVSVQDDGGEFFGSPPVISGNWSWGDCCTDGGVIEDIGCNNAINLDYLISSGIDNILWLTGDINMPTPIQLDFNGDDINISCGSGGICCPLNLDTEVTVVDATCSDSPNGSITLMPTDGIPPYTFDWSNGEMTGMIDNLLPGSYAVTVTDSQGCTEELSVDVNVSPGTPAANPASLEVCSSTGIGEFDLTSVEDDINGGTGFDVHWYMNSDMTGNINNPASYSSGSGTVYAVVDNGACLSQPVPVELTVLPSPVANPTTMNACEVNNGEALFDLTSLDNFVSGGAGNVIWYTDPNLTNEVPDPEEFLTESTTVYAVVDDGTCISDPVEVQLIVDLKPESFPADMNLCGDDAFEAIFDLTLLDIQVSDGMGTVQWYTDAQLDDPIVNPSAFQTTTTIVYAAVFDGVCYSDPAQVHLTVDPTPVGNPITIDVCDDGSSMTLLDLTEYDFAVAGNTGAVDWYLDLFLTEPITDPMNFLTEATIIYATIDNGLCVSEPVAITITLQMNVEGNPTSLSTCADSSGTGVFNLTMIDNVVSGGTGTVQWYEDASGNFPVANSMSFTTSGTTVYAQISNGVCLSELIPVMLNIINTVSATPTIYDECDDGGGIALFDLTSVDSDVSNNTGIVSWYYDSLATIPINPTDSFPSSGVIVWARVNAGPCVSNTVPVNLVVLNTPPSLDVTLQLCGDTNAVTTFDLTTLDTTISSQMGTVSWFVDSALLNALMNPNALLTGDTIVYAVVSNGACLSDPAVIELNVSDGLTANPLTLNFCVPEGDTMFIDLTQSNSAVAGAFGVNWYMDAAGTSPIAVPNSFPGVITTTVFAAATDGHCESEIIPVDIIILETPVANTFTLSKCGQPGEQVLFDLVSIDYFIGELSGNVTWFIDGGATNPILNANSFLSSDSVVYALVTNGFCITGPVAVTLDVTDSLEASAIVIQDCELNTNMATINLTAFDGAISGGSGEVFWFTDSLAMDTIFNSSAYVTTGDTVYAVVSADGCISNVALVPIEIATSNYPLPNCDFTSIDSLALSWNGVTDEFALTYSINGSIIGNNQLTTNTEFNLGGLGQGDTLKLWVTALFDSICTMPLTDSVICITDVCPAQVITFSNLAPVYCRDDFPVNLAINPPGGQLSGVGLTGNVFTPALVPGSSAQLSYQWTEILSGCMYDTSITVEIQNPVSTPLIDCSNPTLSSVTFIWPAEEDNFGYTYNINSGTVVGPLLTSDSSLLFSGLNEGDEVELTIWSIGTAVCGNSDSVTITCRTKVCPPATITIDDPGPLCDDDDPIFLGALVGGLPMSPVPELRWYGPGTVDSFGRFDPMVALPGNNAITALVRQDGCTYLQPGNIVVNETPYASLSIVGTPCIDSVFQVSFNGTTYPGTAEYWNFDFASTSGSSAHDWEASWSTPGDKLIIFALDHEGCVDTFFAPITIDAPLDPLVLECVEEDYYSLTIGWEPIAGANQYTVQSSIGQSVVTGNTVTIKNLPDNTLVNITVTANGNTSCGPSIAEIDCQTLEYIPPRLYIPNVFSPNQDGINDVFYLQGNEYVKDINTLRIFDRWGNVVFEKNNFKPDDPSKGWDGSFHDKIMNPDVFTYWVEFETVYGVVETKAGDVTLVR